MSTVRELTNPKTWNAFLLTHQPNTFLQSWEWGEVQRRDGHHVHRVGFFDQDTQIGAATLITVRAKRGSFLLCPHGPVFSSDEQTLAHLELLVEYARALAKAKQLVGFRVAPLIPSSPTVVTAFHRLNFRSAPIHTHAELTWMLDITSNNSELLAKMRKTTRHAIEKGLKNPALTVTITRAPRDITKHFWPLYGKTATRHDFVLYAPEIITNQLEIFNQGTPATSAYIVIAWHESRAVAAAIILTFGTTAFYYHGASEKLPSHLPASHLVQWHAIQEAKRLQCTRYNFWGIAPKDNPRHPFAGITTFKTGFGGKAIDYLHAQDLPFNFKYWQLWLIDTYRRLTRGF